MESCWCKLYNMLSFVDAFLYEKWESLTRRKNSFVGSGSAYNVLKL